MSARVTLPTSQNLLLQSEDLSNAAWNINSGVSVVDDIPAPDGAGGRAYLITPTGGAGIRHYAAQGGTVAAAYQFNPRQQAYSCFIKAGASTQWVLLGDDRHTSFVNAWFDLTNGVVGSVSADNDTGVRVSSRIESASRYYPNAAAGWYRIEMTFTMTSPSGGAGPNAFGINIGPTTGDSVAVFDSASGVTCWAWGAQVSCGPRWTSNYVKTTGAAVNTGAPRSLAA